MRIVIPMSGRGARFVRAGYDTIKPLIEVDGKPMIEHVVNMFPGERDFLFICADDHLQSTPLRDVLERIAPGADILPVNPHKLGPVHSVLEAGRLISDRDPVIVNYCDFSVHWDYHHFRTTVREADCDGAITAYRGFHPHSLGPNLYGYMRVRDGRLLEIREKESFTDDRMSEFASAGTYYFRDGALLKGSFEEARSRKMETGGEYYASLPYNLIVADGGKVLVYELEHFLQWGTPEDLEEYRGWSDYFARWSRWRPDRPPLDGTVLLPMAGRGERFARAGYRDPKPLIPVSGRPMVQRSLETFPRAHRWTFLCRTGDLRDGRLARILEEGRRHVRVVGLEGTTQGQASTCLLARDSIDPGKPLFIGPCDTAFAYDEGELAGATAQGDVDCLVWTFRNHPHANRNPRQYGWVRTDSEGSVLEVSCKEPLSQDVSRDRGVTGAFWFREARFFFEAADAMIADQATVKGEYYVDRAVDYLIAAGRRAGTFDVLHYICFGTPEDVMTFEYWQRYFSAAPHHPYTGVEEGPGA